MQKGFQRARQPEQKAQRRAHLLETARGLLSRAGAVHSLSLSEIARQAGVAKASVYTYFETREALLLALLWDEWQGWFVQLQARPRGRGGRPATLEGVAVLLSSSLAARPLLCALTAALPAVMEQNLSEQAIRGFKRDALALFGDVAAHLVARAPVLTASGYAGLLHDTAHAIMGLYPSTHPAPAAAAALADPALHFFQRDFATELTRFVCALAADHLRRAGASPRPARTKTGRVRRREGD